MLGFKSFNLANNLLLYSLYYLFTKIIFLIKENHCLLSNLFIKNYLTPNFIYKIIKSISFN